MPGQLVSNGARKRPCSRLRRYISEVEPTIMRSHVAGEYARSRACLQSHEKQPPDRNGGGLRFHIEIVQGISHATEEAYTQSTRARLRTYPQNRVRPQNTTEPALVRARSSVLPIKAARGLASSSPAGHLLLYKQPLPVERKAWSTEK